MERERTARWSGCQLGPTQSEINSNFFPRVQFVKWQNCPSQTPQITKIIWGGIINKKEQHSFWAQIQIPKGF
jgi:hypothetical protein